MAAIECKGIDVRGREWKSRRWLAEYPESHQTLFFAFDDDGKRTLMGGILAPGSHRLDLSGQEIRVLAGALIVGDVAITKEGSSVLTFDSDVECQCDVPVIFGCSPGR